MHQESEFTKFTKKTLGKDFLSHDIFNQIADDHEDLKKMLGQVEALFEADNPDEAQCTFLDLFDYLNAHARAEERTLYDALLKKSSLRENKKDQLVGEQVLKNSEEHRIAEALAKDAKAEFAATLRWKAKFTVLKESLERHMDEEEKYFRAWKQELRKEPGQIDPHELLRRYLSEKSLEFQKMEMQPLADSA